MPAPTSLPHSLSEISSMLQSLDAGMDRESWRNVAFAVHSEFPGDDGFIVFDAWSRGSAKYSQARTIELWRSIKPGEITIATLVHMAQTAGWSPGRMAEPSRAPAAGPCTGFRTSQQSPEKWVWTTPEAAADAFEALPAVSGHPAAAKLLAADYGLSAEMVPSDWRVFNHPQLGPGIVYRGICTDGAPAYKFKSLRRDHGKRLPRILHGSSSAALVFNPVEGNLLAIVAGEEKAAALSASVANAAVLCPLIGEGNFPPEWIEWIRERSFSGIVLCNDADDAGAAANQDIARQLELAGVNGVHLVQWPTRAPQGMDINDVLKADGANGVCNLINTALPQAPTTNRSLSLIEFIEEPRPPLKYHIEGILPERGKLTFSSKAKGFKTSLLLELGMCCALGNVQYLNFKFNAPARVLFLQPELSDPLMSDRLKWIKSTAPKVLDFAAINRNFFVQETQFGRPCLWHEHPRFAKSDAELRAAIKRTGAQILLVDSFYMTFAGIDDISSSEMTMALDYLGELTNSQGVSIILVHHFNKAGTAARGSSVYQGWGESDLEVKDTEDGSDIVRVDALLRCAWPKTFPAYWRKPTEKCAWFELMPEGWEPEKKAGRGRGREVQYRPEQVRMALQAAGSGNPLKFTELRRAIMDFTGCSNGKAADLIKQARDMHLIIETQGAFFPTVSA